MNKTVKELKNICKQKKIKGYSKLNKKQLINLVGGKKSCHVNDDEPKLCNNSKIVKNKLNKYKCKFVIHDTELSKCIKDKNFNKYKKLGYKIYKNKKTKDNKINVEIPEMDEIQKKSDLDRYLNSKKINLYLNNKKIDSDKLRTEEKFLEINSRKMYDILRILISPGFHNDYNVSTFKNSILTTDVFKNKKSDYIMCNVDIKNIDIKIKKDKLTIFLYLSGDLKCVGFDQKVLQRKIKNNYIKMEWEETDKKVLITYLK